MANYFGFQKNHRTVWLCMLTIPQGKMLCSHPLGPSNLLNIKLCISMCNINWGVCLAGGDQGFTSYGPLERFAPKQKFMTRIPILPESESATTLTYTLCCVYSTAVYNLVNTLFYLQCWIWSGSKDHWDGSAGCWIPITLIWTILPVHMFSICLAFSLSHKVFVQFIQSFLPVGKLWAVRFEVALIISQFIPFLLLHFEFIQSCKKSSIFCRDIPWCCLHLGFHILPQAMYSFWADRSTTTVCFPDAAIFKVEKIE